jgi:hypothetical protein
MKNVLHILVLVLVLALIRPVIANALTLDLDYAFTTGVLDFETLEPGKDKELKVTNSYYNQATCKSNTNSTWELKISADPFTLGSKTIPNSNFKWMSVYAYNKNSPNEDLSAGLEHPPSDGYVEFTTSSDLNLVYRSGRVPAYNDNLNTPNGTAVQFQYYLKVPGSTMTGTYTTKVRYTLTQ